MEVSRVKPRFLACSDAELSLNEVYSVDQLRDGMFDMEAGVHLQEDEFAGAWRHEEFHDTRTAVLGYFPDADGCRKEFFPKLGGHARPTVAESLGEF